MNVSVIYHNFDNHLTGIMPEWCHDFGAEAPDFVLLNRNPLRNKPLDTI